MEPYLTLEALRRAFSRVRENHGCAGTDGVTIEAFASDLDGALRGLRESVECGSYWAWPLRKVEVEKKPGSVERRRLLIPSVRDRVLQTAVAAFLEPFLEKEFEASSFGYRRGRSVRTAVERVHALYHEGYHWVLDADIDDFFDSVPADLVLSRLGPVIHDETVLRLVKLWLDYAVWDGLRLERPGIGLPQGAVVSPMLANLVLDQLDEALLDSGFAMVRYADDFVVLAKSRARIERALEITEDTLSELRLKLNEDKTRIVRFKDTFRFLGVVFLKDMLLQPWRTGRKQLKLVAMAGPIPAHFFPVRERRMLRAVRL